jgi:hypothetical protein
MAAAASLTDKTAITATKTNLEAMNKAKAALYQFQQLDHELADVLNEVHEANESLKKLESKKEQYWIKKRFPNGEMIMIDMYYSLEHAERVLAQLVYKETKNVFFIEKKQNSQLVITVEDLSKKS